MQSSVLIRPILTEKLVRLGQRSQNTQYAFVVRKDANKIQIRQEVEARFNVNVESVRTAIVAPRVRRRFTKTGVLVGKSASYKKAFVTIRQGQQIQYFESEE